MKNLGLLAGVNAFNQTSHFNETLNLGNNTLGDLQPIPGARPCPSADNFNDDPDGTKVFPKVTAKFKIFNSNELSQMNSIP